MAQFAAYISRGLCNPRLIFPRINRPNVTLCAGEFLWWPHQSGAPPQETRRLPRVRWWAASRQRPRALRPCQERLLQRSLRALELLQANSEDAYWPGKPRLLDRLRGSGQLQWCLPCWHIIVFNMGLGRAGVRGQPNLTRHWHNVGVCQMIGANMNDTESYL